MRKHNTAILFSLILILLLIIAQPTYAATVSKPQEVHNIDSRSPDNRSAAPNNRPLASLKELLEWYARPLVWNEFPVLANEITIDRQVTLSETATTKELGAISHCLRVKAGGSLTLNNSKLVIQGPDTVIVVEAGGQLLLQNGAIFTAPSSHSIVVEKGGKVVKSAAFLLDGGKILDKNQSNELPTDPDSTPAPDPQPPAVVLPPITTVFEDNYLSCTVGAPPEQSDYPSTVTVAYLATETSHQQIKLLVQWNLDSVNFEVAGIYTVKGTFSEDVLTAHHLSNPNGISAILKLAVQETGAIKTLTGNVLSISSNGLCLIRLTVPALASDVEALYVYKSADGIRWEKCSRQGGLTDYCDFLPYVQTVSLNTYVNYRYQTDYRPIWLRVEIVGSSAAGISNEIKLEMPASAKPGDSTHTGETGNDGGSGGNRGGGGQSEGERELPVADQSDKGESGFSFAGKPQVEETILPTVPSKNSSGKTGSTSENTRKDLSQNSDTSMLEDVSKDSHGSTLLLSIISRMAQMGLTKKTAPSLASTQEQNAEPVAEVAVSNSTTKVGSNLPFQKSRGVLLTAGATGFAVCGFVLFQKLVQKRKRKP